MEFTVDWMNANAEDWQLLFDTFKPKTYLEVGSFEGRSACHVITSTKSLKEIVCVDAWDGYADLPDIDMEAVEKRFNRNVQEALHLRESEGANILFHKYKGKSHQTLAGLCWNAKKEEHFDVVYIDGSHTPEDVMLDLMLGLRLVKTGGLLIADDYLWCLDVDGDDLLRTPRLAIDTFGLVMRRYVSDVPRLSLYQRYYQKMRRVP